MERQYKLSKYRKRRLGKIPRGVYSFWRSFLGIFHLKRPLKNCKKNPYLGTSLTVHSIQSIKGHYCGLYSQRPSKCSNTQFQPSAEYMRDGHRRSGLECKIMSHGLALIEQLPTMATRRCRHKFYFANPPLSYLLFLCLWKGSILDSYFVIPKGTIIKSRVRITLKKLWTMLTKMD